MHVRYIVYYRGNNRLPSVDIWTTKGDMIHSTYAAFHDIRPQSLSSCGDLLFNFSKNRWELDHWQMDGFDYKSKKRDKALVQKKIHETEFLKDETLRNQCRKVSFFRRIFQHD